MEDDLEVGDIAYLNPSVVLTSTFTFSEQTANFDFQYKPGFQVDLGVNFAYDNWDLFAAYTWYHTGNMTTSISEPGIFSTATGSASGPLILSKLQGVNPSADSTLVNYTSRTWNLKMDFLDLMLARTYFVGTQLKFRPSFGPRGAWIRQKLNVFEQGNQAYAVVAGTYVLGATTSLFNTIVSWGYGLKGAIEADWMLGAGFKMFGNAAADLLYTNYNLSGTSSGNQGPSGHLNTVYHSQKNVGSIRPHMELELGFGYGIDINNAKQHFDILAAYGFQVFWDQNMFLENTSSPLPLDDLYVHGLRVTALFAF
jgi:hypothetical protein